MTFAGATWVFIRSNGVWTQQVPKLVGAGAVGEAHNKGIRVALSADGNTAAVGGPSDNASAGGAWVFTRSNGVWTQQGPKLIGTGAVGSAEQGLSVALSADGNTAIVGGFADSAFTGAAWVFTRSGGVWTQQGLKLVGTGAVGAAQQGISVALSADGNTALVGGTRDNSFAGATWVFTRSSGVWTQQAPKLVGAGAVGGAQQGSSVALSADGNTAIVGGWGDNSFAGASWVFTRSNGIWAQQGPKLVGTGAVGSDVQQGYSVALSAAGNTAIVGGNTDNEPAGAAWVFTRSNGIWTQQGAKLVGAGAVGGANQGYSVALSAAGNTAIVGGSSDNSVVGAAWVFIVPPPHDFNGDGKSDILWRDTAGDVGMWLMNGAQILQGAAFNAVATNWSIVGQRDFNGDGKSDILWRDTVGDVGMWLMNGTQIVQGGSFSAIPLNWSVAGTGDFNGDGKADILWIDNQGNVGIWFMNGTQILQAGVVGQLPPNWIIVGADMKGDIFLRNTSSGDVGMWVMNGSHVAQSVDFGSVPLNWTVAGIGDFDGNGSFDLLWRDTAGDAAIWLMNGTSIMSTTVLGNLPTSWNIAETGDFNGDGKSDVLWVDNTGNVAIWFMNGTNVSSGKLLRQYRNELGSAVAWRRLDFPRAVGSGSRADRRPSWPQDHRQDAGALWTVLRACHLVRFADRRHHVPRNHLTFASDIHALAAASNRARSPIRPCSRPAHRCSFFTGAVSACGADRAGLDRGTS